MGHFKELHFLPCQFYKMIDHRIVVTILGKAGCGKTCLLKRMCSNDFTKTEPTVAPEHQKLKIETETEDIILDFWDTAGQEKFNAINSAYIRRGDIIILAFEDYDNYLEDIKFWHQKVLQQLSNPIIIVVATKQDQKDDEEVDAIKKLAPEIIEQFNASSFLVTSSLSGIGIQDLINEIACLSQTVVEKKKTEVDANQKKLEPMKKTVDDSGCC